MLTVNQLTLTHRKDLTVLVDSLSFTLNDGERLALIGEEGNGKSTLLHLIRNTLEKRSDLRVFYMPQDVGDLLDFSLSPVELLSPSGKKEERSRAGILLGSMKFTADEMNHPCAGLSGGQKAKLMFLMMAESGARVAMIGRNAEKIQMAADMLKDSGDVHAYALDVSDVEAIPGVVEKIRQELGEIRFLIQAAGIMAGGPGVDLTPQEWDRVMNTNAKGLFFMMQQCVKQSMIPQDFGAIVNIASMAGIRGMTPPMCSAQYSASKGAVVAVSMQAAVEWASSRIRVNAIAPGGVLSGGAGVHIPKEGQPGPGGPGAPGPGPGGPTTGVPTGRLSDPEEIAGMAAYLLSEYSENTTGQVIVIDGGSTAVGY